MEALLHEREQEATAAAAAHVARGADDGDRAWVEDRFERVLARRVAHGASLSLRAASIVARASRVGSRGARGRAGECGRVARLCEGLCSRGAAGRARRSCLDAKAGRPAPSGVAGCAASGPSGPFMLDLDSLARHQVGRLLRDAVREHRRDGGPREEGVAGWGRPGPDPARPAGRDGPRRAVVAEHQLLGPAALDQRRDRLVRSSQLAQPWRRGLRLAAGGRFATMSAGLRRIRRGFAATKEHAPWSLPTSRIG